MKKIPDESSAVTLNDFLNMWWYRDFPVAVVPYADFDDAAERGMSLEQYIDNGEHDVLFSLAASGADAYQMRAYIRDRYAYGRVKAFMFMDAWCVIGIEEYEPDKEEYTIG